MKNVKKRRGNGEGCIFQLRDGTWRGVLNVGFVDAKRKRKSFRGKTHREVTEKMTRAKGALLAGLPPTNEKATMSWLLRRWLDDRKPMVRLTTFQGYEEIVRLYLDPALGRMLVARMRSDDVKAFMKARLAGGSTATRVRYMRVVLRAALRFAMKNELAVRNVVQATEPPKVDRKEVEPLNIDEARVLLRAVRGDAIEGIVAIALAMGLRRGEILGLRWEDIDLESGALHVRQQLQRPKGGGWVLVPPKSERSRRRLRIPDAVRRLLVEHRRRQAEDRLAAGPEWAEHGFVFTSSNGAPLHGSNVLRDFKKLLATAKLPKKRLHDARHSCASFLLAEGVSLRVVQDILGHSDIRLTANTYSHVLPQLHDDAAEKMNRLLG